MSSTYSSRGYITLADIDNFNTRLNDIEELTRTIDAQVSGSSDLMYYASAGPAGDLAATPLTLTQTAIEAVRLSVNLAGGGQIQHVFKAPFLEVPVVTAICDTRGDAWAAYAASIVSVSTTQVTLLITKINTKTATTSSEGLNIIAVGKTAA